LVATGDLLRRSWRREKREMNEIEPKMRTMREKERPREIKREGGITRRH
jgi:hypothetical protein